MNQVYARSLSRQLYGDRRPESVRGRYYNSGRVILEERPRLGPRGDAHGLTVADDHLIHDIPNAGSTKAHRPL
jgi:hypothetical protein